MGDGNYTTEFRQLNSALGRWMTPDPVFQPWQSPYNSMDGNPVNLNDPMGLYTGDEEVTELSSEADYNNAKANRKDGTTFEVRYDENGAFESATQYSKAPVDQKAEAIEADRISIEAMGGTVYTTNEEKGKEFISKGKNNPWVIDGAHQNGVWYDNDGLEENAYLKKAGVAIFVKGSFGVFSATAEIGTNSESENDLSAGASIKIAVKFADLKVKDLAELKADPKKLADFFNKTLKSAKFSAFGNSTKTSAEGGGVLQFSTLESSKIDRAIHDYSDNLTIEAYIDNSTSINIGWFLLNYSDATETYKIGMGRSTSKIPVPLKNSSSVVIKFKYATTPIWFKL